MTPEEQLAALVEAAEAVFNPDHCPAHLAESLTAYAERGIPVGSFLEAVLANDLFDAVGRADHCNARQLPAIVSFVYNRLPRDCHGSRELYEAWLAAHRARLLAQRETGA